MLQKVNPSLRKLKNGEGRKVRTLCYLYSLIMFFAVTLFLLTGNAGKVYAHRNKNDAQIQNCINKIEDIIKSVDGKVYMVELSNDRIQDINEIKNKYDVFKLQYSSISRTKNLASTKHENCIRKSRDLISNLHMNVNKILMEVTRR